MLCEPRPLPRLHAVPQLANVSIESANNTISSSSSIVIIIIGIPIIIIIIISQ